MLISTTIMAKKQILFVCLGNICRSPAAEAIMKHILEQEGMSQEISVDSAGTGPWHVGQLPDPRMRSHGLKHGYHIDSIAWQFKPVDFDRFTLIVAMDDMVADDLRGMARSPYDLHKIVGMASFLRHHPMNNIVPDPYYGRAQDFELVIELLEDACQGLFEHLTSHRRQGRF